MANRISLIGDRIIEYSFYLLFFLVPLILTPWNYELFEFNKMMLTYLFTTVIIAAWLVKMARERTVLFRRTILDIPLILFLTSQLISTYLSIDRHTSLWGYYSRFNGGLLSTISYLLLYWAFVSNMDKEKTLSVIRYMLYATLLVALYGIAEHFGIDAQYWVQKVQERVFSTLGQPNWLAAWLVALTPLTWSFALNSKIKEPKAKLQSKIQKFSNFYMSFLFLIFYICILYTKSRSGFLGFTITYFVFWSLVFFKSSLAQIKTIAQNCAKPFLIIALLTLAITLFIGSPWSPSAGEVINKSRGRPAPEPEEATISAETESVSLVSESGDIRKIVWQGAVEIWKHYPVFGTGVETFAYSYYWYRPRAHNDVSEWDLLYNKAHNEYLTILANSGIIGLVTYLGLIGTFLGWSLHKIKNQISKIKVTNKNSKFYISDYHFDIYTLHFAFLAGYISILITNFFGFSVVPVNLLFFLMPAMVMTLGEIKEKTKKEKQTKLKTKQKIAMVIIFLLALSVIIYLAKFWYADTRFAVAEKLNDSAWYERSYNELQTAISLHPNEPYYHNEMSLTLAGLAGLANEADNATLSAQFTEMAISESNEALKISPYHLNFWKNRAKIFISLAKIDPNYQQNALGSLLRAAELAPTDAKVFYNLGLLYSSLDQEETAVKTMEQTVELKPNYAQARYALALFYEEEGKIKEAKEQLEYILEKINPVDTRAKNKLDEL